MFLSAFQRLFLIVVLLLGSTNITFSQKNTSEAMSKIKSKTIVFITGAYVSHACWDDWRIYFESQGYTTLAPPWPGKDADPATLRSRHPDKKLASVTLPDVLQHYMDIIDKLPEKPIIIGHSFGGLMAQVLLNRGYAAAAVSIHGVPPKGILPLAWNFLKSNAATLGYFSNADKTYMMPFKKWQFAFTNGLSEEVQRSSYAAITIPESKRAARGGLSNAAHVDFKKEHNPLLILAGTKDQCIPLSLCRKNYKKYKTPNSVTDFVVKDRNHYVLGLPTWKDDAQYIVEWLKQH